MPLFRYPHQLAWSLVFCGPCVHAMCAWYDGCAQLMTTHILVTHACMHACMARAPLCVHSTTSVNQCTHALIPSPMLSLTPTSRAPKPTHSALTHAPHPYHMHHAPLLHPLNDSIICPSHAPTYANICFLMPSPLYAPIPT